MIAKLAGVALDARVASRIGDSRTRALAAQWIAKNALAARGVRVDVDRDDIAVDERVVDILGRRAVDLDGLSLARGSSPRLAVDTQHDIGDDARWLAIRATTLTGLLAALAAIPALVDPTTIPRRWRVALRALGLPMLDKPLADAPPPMAGSIALAARPWLDGASTCSVHLDVFATGYRVRGW